MTDIASLAGVQRPVVSMWRSRFREHPDSPFPTPLEQSGDHGAVLFDEEDVRRWLVETGHGNNAEVSEEIALYGGAMGELAANPDSASALLLLHHLVQSPLSELSADEVDEAIMLSQLPTAILPPAIDFASLGERPLLEAVDAVVDAVYTADVALHRLAQVTGVAPRGGRPALVTARAKSFLAALWDELPLVHSQTVAPLNRAALALLAYVLPAADSVSARVMVSSPGLMEEAYDRVLWRLLAVSGYRIESPLGDLFHGRDDGAAPGAGGGCLSVIGLDGNRGLDSAQKELEDRLLSVGRNHRALVVGPAMLLTDPRGAKDRARLLSDVQSLGMAVQYVARLPKNLMKRSARQRSALWILGGADAVSSAKWAVVADYGDAELSADTGRTLAADIAAAMSGDGATVHTHAFRAGGPVTADALRIADDVTAPRHASAPEPMGADLLAEAMNVAPAFTRELRVEAEHESRVPIRVSWNTLTRQYGNDKAGVKISRHELVDSGAGTVVVIGPEEIRGLTPWGERRIDRLRLELVAPRARFTEPGDVLYVAPGGPSAVVDDAGGHVVLSPARVFRPRGSNEADREGLRAASAVVARDIADQTVSDKDAWRIRLVPKDQAGDVEVLRQAAARRRKELCEQQEKLDRAERALMRAMTTGTVRIAREKNEKSTAGEGK